MRSPISVTLKARYWVFRERSIESLCRKWSALTRKVQILELWFRTFGKPVTTVDGVKVRLGFHLSREIRRSIWSGEYEGPERRMVLAKLSTDDVVMELGAGIGLLSALCAKRIGSSRVHTYEANPALIPYIRETFALNGVEPALKNCLVGDHEGDTAFYLHREFWASSTLPVNGARPIVLRMVDVNHELQAVRPTFLIIDIEGGEYDLFQHIDLGGVRKLAIETHPRVLGRDKVDFIKSTIGMNNLSLVEHLSTRRHFFFER